MSDSSVPYPRDPESGPPVSRGRLGALLWIGCESMVFAGLIGTFVLARFSSTMWPAPYSIDGVQYVPKRVLIWIPIINAVVLSLATLYAMKASKAARGGDEAVVRRCLNIGSWLGVLFLALVVTEWKIEADRGLRLSSGPYGSFVILITFVHAVHVLAGVVWHWVITRRPLNLPLGGLNIDRISITSLWWGYVTAVWFILLILLHLA